MTSRTNFAESGQRTQGERRRGGDSRSPNERLLQGERRRNDGRAPQTRDGASLRRSGWLYMFLFATLLCYLDVKNFDGAHSTQVAIELGKGASSLAHRWIDGAFGR